jgi:hypothetical protein
MCLRFSKKKSVLQRLDRTVYVGRGGEGLGLLVVEIAASNPASGMDACPLSPYVVCPTQRLWNDELATTPRSPEVCVREMNV